MEEVIALIGRGCVFMGKAGCDCGKAPIGTQDVAFCRVKSGKREVERRRFANSKIFFIGDYNVTMSRSGVMRCAPRRYAVTLRRAHYHQTSHTMGGCDGGEGGAWGNVTA